MRKQQGDRLKQVRIELGLKQKDFALQLGITPTALSEIENGRNNISQPILRKLMNLYGLDANWLVNGEGPMRISDPVKTITSVEELKQRFLSQFTADRIHPMHLAMLEEVCERVMENEVDDETRLWAVMSAFRTAHQLMVDMINGTLEASGADTATINYRGQQFIIRKDAAILKPLP